MHVCWLSAGQSHAPSPVISRSDSDALLPSFDHLAPATAFIQTLSPIPRCQKVRARKRRVQSAEVVTGTPYKNKLIEKARSKEQSKLAPASKKQLFSKQKKKKQTCRADKPRGRQRQGTAVNKSKAKNRAADQEQSSGKSAKQNASRCRSKSGLSKARRGGGETTVCRICQEVYVEPPVEDWIQCGTCKAWFHEACTEGESSQGFKCDFCRDTLFF